MTYVGLGQFPEELLNAVLFLKLLEYSRPVPIIILVVITGTALIVSTNSSCSPFQLVLHEQHFLSKKAILRAIETSFFSKV